MARKFNLWTCCCSHAGTDLRGGRRRSLAEAVSQAERSFAWDIALHLGDHCGALQHPDDEEGEEIRAQFGALSKHRREDFYCIAGNHDASPHTESEMWWFKKWIDPAGENSQVSGVHAAKRKYPVDGTWERYSFRVGNLLFLMMSDLNHFPPPVGRGTEIGGHPGGVVRGETFAWWREQVESNPGCIIISTHHYMLRETTTASGPFEGFTKNRHGEYEKHYHSYYENGSPEGAGYLYFVDDQPNAQLFEKHLNNNPGAIDLWIGGHTHTHPDDVFNGRSLIERKWDVSFINTSALTVYHKDQTGGFPMSRLLTFTEGSTDVRVQCFMHTSDYAPQGFYAKAERTLPLSKPFTMESP